MISQSPKASAPWYLIALDTLRTNLTSTKPATPKCQTSSPDRATAPRPSARKDFATSSTYSSSTPESPLPHCTVKPRPSPSRAFENSLAHSAPEQQNVILPPTFIANAARGERPEFDNDSGFLDNGSDTTSIDSGLRDPEMHGSLPYTPNSNYPFPCDEKELWEREPLTHEAVWRLRKYHAKPFLGMEHLHLEPFNGYPQRTVELGAGTCLWAKDFGEAYPSTKVEAIDSNRKALYSRELFPPQVDPILDNVEKEWGFGESSLDFIRAGHLLSSIKDRPRLLAQSWYSLKPLCRAEFIGFHYVPHDEDGSEVENALSNFYQRLAEAMSKGNLDLSAITNTREELISAGFINVREEVLRMPIGKWMEDPELKEIGRLFGLVVKSAIPDIAIRAIEEGLEDWSSREVTVLGAQAKGSLGSPMYFPLHIVTGQKPASWKAT